jgi:hypothetical protein
MSVREMQELLKIQEMDGAVDWSRMTRRLSNIVQVLHSSFMNLPHLLVALLLFTSLSLSLSDWCCGIGWHTVIANDTSIA